MSLPIVVLVDDVDVTAKVDPQWLHVTIPTSRRGATATLHLLDDNPPSGVSVSPPATVGIYDVDESTLIFDGLVTKAQVRAEVGGTLNRWMLTCNDVTWYFDGVIVNEIYTNMTVDAIIKAMFAKYLPAIDTSMVAAGPPVSSISFPWQTITQSLRKLLKYAQVTETIIWYVTPGLKLFWGTISQLATSALVINDLPPPDANTHFGLQGQGGYAEWDMDLTQAVTQVIVRGATVLSVPNVETFIGNGVQTSFALAYQPSQQKGAMPVTLTVGGAGKTVKFDNGTTPTSQWVVVNQLFGSATSQPGSSAVRIGTDDVPPEGAQVVVTYQYDAPIIAVVDDLAHEAAYDVPGALTSGIYQQVITDQTLQTVQSARARGLAHLASYAPMLQTITVPLMEDYAGLVPQVGTIVSFQSNQFGLNSEYVITGLVVRGTADAQRQIILTLENR